MMSIDIVFVLNKLTFTKPCFSYLVYCFKHYRSKLFISYAFLSRCIKWPVWPQRLKWLLFLPTLPTKRIKTDEYQPPLQSARGCDLSSLVLPVFHSGQPMRSSPPMQSEDDERWEEADSSCSLRWHPNHFLIYNFTTAFFSLPPELKVNRRNNLEAKIASV